VTDDTPEGTPDEAPKAPSRSLGRMAIRPSLKPRELITPVPDLHGVWKAKIITLFPAAFPGVLGESLTGKALQDGLWQLETLDLRRWGIGKHRNVDDTPAGGGAGMVLPQLAADLSVAARPADGSGDDARSRPGRGGDADLRPLRRGR
jgi:tRNA (guanine37-N1)-methyltransferase